ncbi:UDP-glucose 4-epimerase GalE [Ktedonospora formicarum]|uniref:UDP-glucose 4-epimerase n=1 Tax=Ktedonospora formicarum TaxID=2778364 RepID=A0A8J3HZZ9_9CHLR|nr:UDP-glucose 4-epimerase GalE [Ktedonospora formicarum]GHO44108.1 UDP-glucose 4-epimerase GalE [Ktedonospora formicarum]
MKLLVTGGAGYIGSVMTKQLVEAGHEVTVMDNFTKGHHQAVQSQVRIVESDLLDPQRLKEVLSEGYTGVLHFAALSLVGESVTQPERYYRNNVVGTLNLLDAMRENGVKRLVFSSTAAVYGAPEGIPILETSPTRPTNPYGGSKLAVDQMLGFEAEAHGLAAVSLRYFNVAGASGDIGELHNPETHLIPLVLQAAAGKRESVQIYGTDYATPDGTAIRDYIHVEDLARAHTIAFEHAQAGRHTIYNLGNGKGFSVREVIETARRVTGKPIKAIESERRVGDPPVLVASSEKVQRELGWQPQKPELSTMIADAWNWMQTHPQGYTS